MTVQHLRIGIVAVLAVALFVLGRGSLPALSRLPSTVAGFGAWAPIVFVAVYAIATVAFLPGALLTLAAGGLFGVVKGAAIVLSGATLGASLAFLIARYAARELVERRLADSARFAALDRAVGREGRRIVFLLRLSPLYPFNLLNYALGLTRVRFTDYVLASVGMIPGTLLYVYTGAVAGEAVAVAGGAGPARGPWHYLVLGLGLAATIGVTVFVTRIARRALATEVG